VPEPENTLPDVSIHVSTSSERGESSPTRGSQNRIDKLFVRLCLRLSKAPVLSTSDVLTGFTGGSHAILTACWFPVSPRTATEGVDYVPRHRHRNVGETLMIGVVLALALTAVLALPLFAVYSVAQLPQKESGPTGPSGA